MRAKEGDTKQTFLAMALTFGLGLTASLFSSSPTSVRASQCDNQDAPFVSVEARDEVNTNITGLTIFAQKPGNAELPFGSTPISFKSVDANTTYDFWVATSGWDITGLKGGSNGAFDFSTKKAGLNTGKASGVPADYCFLIVFSVRKLATGTTFKLEGIGKALSYELKWDKVADAKNYKIFKDGSQIFETSATLYAPGTASPGTYQFFVQAHNSAGTKIATSNTVPVTVTASGETITGETVGDDCGCPSAVTAPFARAFCVLSCYIVGIIAKFVNLSLNFLQKTSGL